MIRNTILGLLLASLGACSAPVTRQAGIDNSHSETEKTLQRELAFQSQVNRSLKAQRVGLPILRESASHCGSNTAPHLGFLAFTRAHFKGELQEAASKHWQLSDEYKIVEVFANSPASKAGLQAGDIVVRINNQAVTPTSNELRKLIAAPYTTGLPVPIDIMRAGEAQTLTLEMEVICNYPVNVVSNDAVNAYADGKAIYITSGMMRFTETDEELATVIGHELAHNQMDHIGKQSNNRVLGVILGAIVTVATGVDVTNLGGNLGAGAFSQDFEAEADYVGIYATARAGYDIKQAPNFWRRMGAEHPAGIAHGASHPNTANRYLALDKAVQEIAEKKTAGLALAPNLK